MSHVAELQNYYADYAFHILFMPPFLHILSETLKSLYLTLPGRNMSKKYVLLQFPFHFAFLGPSRESQYDPLHTLSPGVCTSCLSPDETNEAATWWPTLHHWIHPPKTNGWNLKMMVSKAGSSFFWGVRFQVNQPLVFGGSAQNWDLVLLEAQELAVPGFFSFAATESWSTSGPKQVEGKSVCKNIMKQQWNIYSESSKLFEKFTRSQTGPVSPWGIS